MQTVVEAVASAYVREVDDADRNAEETRLAALRSARARIQAEIEHRDGMLDSGAGRPPGGDVEIAQGTESADNRSDLGSPKGKRPATLQSLASRIDREINVIANRPRAILLNAPTPLTADVQRRNSIIEWITLAAFGLTFVLAATVGVAARHLRTRRVSE